MYRDILAATDGSDSANKAVKHAATLAKATGARLTIVNVTQMWSSLDIVQDRAPAEGIVAAAKDKGCDLIVMGTHGRRGLGRLLLGSQAVEVLTTSTVPVLIVR
jgi:nucleotide-binding universal stress UspA family protein